MALPGGGKIFLFFSPLPSYSGDPFPEETCPPSLNKTNASKS